MFYIIKTKTNFYLIKQMHEYKGIFLNFFIIYKDILFKAL